MLKYKIKWSLCGFIAAVILMNGGAFGKSLTATMEVIYNDVKIMINGKDYVPKDVNGNIVEPFISDGTTYLPVRAVANAFGKEVSWDNSTNTVIIDDSLQTPDFLSTADYSISIADGWTVKEQLQGIYVFTAPDGLTNFNILVENAYYWDGEDAESVADYLDESKINLAALFKGVSFGNDGEELISTYNGYTFDYSVEISGKKVDYTMKFILAQKKAYIFTVLRTGNSAYTDDISGMLKTFKMK